ncbi:MAG: gas vesicle protein GvpD [Minicystis sp.]
MTERPARAEATSGEKVSTGVLGLDAVLGGGLKRNRVYLVLGDPGVGKTTMALQFLLDGCRSGEPCLYATLSESREEIEDIAESHGWTIDGVEMVELQSGRQSLHAGDAQTMFHPAEIDLEEFVAPLLREVERVKPARAVIDSLSELRIMAQDQRRFRRQIMALKAYFQDLGTTVLLLDDRTTESAEMVPLTFAHGVVVMEAVRREYGAPRRRLSVAKLRGARIREGYHDVRIVTGGLVVYPRLVASERPATHEPGSASSGAAELDAMLGGGILRGTSALLLGPAGVGKSVLTTQYMHAAATRGEGCAAFLFDEGREGFLLRAAGAGLDLGPHLDTGLVRLEQVNPAEMSPGEFTHAVIEAVDARGARLVVIDSLNGYLCSVPEETFLPLHLHELLTYLDQRGVTTLLTLTQHGVLGAAARSDIDVSYLADTVILMRFFEADGEMHKAISVPKMRSGLHELTLREYRITRSGFRIGGPLREFQGVLTGTPSYVGSHEPLLRGDTNAA